MNAPVHTKPLSQRKITLRAFSERMAAERHRWIERNAYFYEDDRRYMRFLVPEGARVLELGCGIGDLLAALKPSLGIGVDFSPAMLEQARSRHPHLQFVLGDVEDPSVIQGLTGPFDYIVLSDTIGAFDDCEATLASLQPLCHRETRLIVSYYSHLWEPILTFGSWIGLRMPQVEQNFLPPVDIQNLLALADFEVLKREWRWRFEARLEGRGSAGSLCKPDLRRDPNLPVPARSSSDTHGCVRLSQIQGSVELLLFHQPDIYILCRS